MFLCKKQLNSYEHSGNKYGNRIPEIVECWNTSGDYDFIMKIYVSDMKRYQDFVLNTLGVVESIGSLHSFFVIGTVKNGTVPIPKAE